MLHELAVLAPDGRAAFTTTGEGDAVASTLVGDIVAVGGAIVTFALPGWAPADVVVDVCWIAESVIAAGGCFTRTGRACLLYTSPSPRD